MPVFIFFISVMHIQDMHHWNVERISVGESNKLD